MTTKEQERKALEQIRKIIAGLGDDSYIGMAFEGVLEDAADNIENDFGNSWRQRTEKAQEAAEYFHKIANDQCKEIADLEQEREELKEDCKALNERIEKLVEEKQKAQLEAVKARKEVKVNGKLSSFAEIKFYNNDGFRFVNVVQESGWVTSYKIDDLEELEIK